MPRTLANALAAIIGLAVVAVLGWVGGHFSLGFYLALPDFPQREIPGLMPAMLIFIVLATMALTAATIAVVERLTKPDRPGRLRWRWWTVLWYVVTFIASVSIELYQRYLHFRQFGG